MLYKARSGSFELSNATIQSGPLNESINALKSLLGVMGRRATNVVVKDRTFMAKKVSLLDGY